MPQAVSYIRFSSVSQAGGSTTDRQKARVSEWIENNKGVTLSNLSKEDPGISGFKGENLKHGLGKILKAIELGKIKEGDFLLIEALDRLGRDEPLKMMKRCEAIISKGITIVTLEDNQTYSNEEILNHPGVLQTLLGKIIQANNYSRQLSYRISEAYENKRIRAKRGEKIKVHNAYWLDKEGQLVKEKSDHVLFCVNLYLKGYGIFNIFRMLTNNFPETKNINPTTIKRWLNNPSLIGVWRNKGDYIDNVFEPLIDKATYIRLNNEIKRRSKSSERQQVYVLSGLLKCRKCNKNYHFRRKVDKNNVIVYCHCSTFLKKGVNYCKNNVSKPYPVIYAILEETLGDSLEMFTAKKVTDKLAIKLTEKIYEKEELEKKLQKAHDIAMRFDGDNEFEIQEYSLIKNALKKVKSEINVLEVSVENESREYLSQEDIRNANDLYEKLVASPVELNESLKKVGYQILASEHSIMVNNQNVFQIYKVIRRSQKFKCYIVKKRSTAKVDKESQRTRWVYYAVDRVGILVTASSDKKLMRRLEERKYNLQHEPEIYMDLDGHISIEQTYEWLHGSAEARDHDEGRDVILKEKLEVMKSR